MKNSKRVMVLFLCLLMSVCAVFSADNAFAETKPATVSGFSVEKYDASSVTLEWKKVKGANGYIIYKYSSSNKKWIMVKQIKKGSITSVKINKLSDGTQYKFKICAYKVKGKKKLYSSKSTVITAYTRPKSPDSFTVKRNNSQYVKLSWKKVKNASGYVIEYKNKEGKWERIYKTSNNQTTSCNLQISTDCTLRIKAYSKIKKKTLFSKSVTVNVSGSSKNNTVEIISDSSENTIASQTSTQTTIQEDKYTVNELYCYNGTQKIYGKMYLPADKTGKLPTVILSHSHSLTCDTMNAYCTVLANEGYAAYCFDFCGGSENSRSDGSMSDMTVFTEVSDLKAVISQLRELDYIDENNLFLLGTSQGGLVSALTANDVPEQIKGMVLMYPAFNIADQMKFFGDNIPENGMTTSISGTIGHDYIATIKDYDIYANIAGFKNDVLIIHGTADNVVPISYSEKAVQTYNSAELKKIDGAGHGFNKDNYSILKDYDEQVNPLIIEYLLNHTA
ncbi:MAG: alpha/beta fold hydrolase [Eubacterium sp.]